MFRISGLPLLFEGPPRPLESLAWAITETMSFVGQLIEMGNRGLLPAQFAYLMPPPPPIYSAISHTPIEYSSEYNTFDNYGQDSYLAYLDLKKGCLLWIVESQYPDIISPRHFFELSFLTLLPGLSNR